MKTIWKFPLKVEGEQSLQMPEGATILGVQVQGGVLNIWAQVSPARPMQRRVIEIIGTGHPIDECERDFICTVQMRDGQLVWHIFEKL